MLIKDMPILERPRERLIKYGVNNLSLNELLTIILKSGTKNNDINTLVENLILLTKENNPIDELSLSNLLKVKGIGLAKACTLLASVELGKRLSKKETNKKNIKFSTPNKIYDYFKDVYKNKKQEEFYCMYLDNKNNLIDKKLLFKGTVNQSLIHPREIFKEAYMLSASFIICIHNHPTGDTTPSNEDISSTKLIYELGMIHGIYLRDHIIVGKDNYYSFCENKNIIN